MGNRIAHSFLNRGIDILWRTYNRNPKRIVWINYDIMPDSHTFIESNFLPENCKISGLQYLQQKLKFHFFFTRFKKDL